MKQRIACLLLMFALSVAIGVLSACKRPQAQSKVPIRIGWQIGWATQGQLAQVLNHTDILDRHGLAAEFKGFSYGGPLNKAALAGEIDVIFTADQPAATLIARGVKWKIVARLIDFRACLIVPPDSPVQAPKDLKGKIIAIPFGSTTHRIVLAMLKEAGLNPQTDVILKNLDILEQTALAQTSGGDKWGQIDAMASWDPTVALLESKKLTRVIEARNALSVVVMSEDFLKKDPEAAVRFLKAYRLAYAYYAIHQNQANAWFAEETKTQLDKAVLNKAASFERNMRAKSVTDIQITLSDSEIAQIQEGADFGLAQKLTTWSPNMRKATDLSFVTSALTAPDLMKVDEVRVR